jgi:hypothetical protein
MIIARFVTGTVKCEAVDLGYLSLTFAVGNALILLSRAGNQAVVCCFGLTSNSVPIAVFRIKEISSDFHDSRFNRSFGSGSKSTNDQSESHRWPATGWLCRRVGQRR